MRWMLSSSPTYPGQFFRVPETPGTAAAPPSGASRSADTVSDPRGGNGAFAVPGGRGDSRVWGRRAEGGRTSTSEVPDLHR